MSSLLRALRSLVRTPGFAVVSIVTLALAIASIGTLFAVVDAVLLKPLPFPEAERIIRIVRVQGSCTDCPISRAALTEWQQQSADAFAPLGAFTGMNATLTGDGAAEQLSASRVTPEFWDVFKVTPLLGRTFTADDDQQNRAVAVISYAFWQRRFAGDPAVVGKTFTLNGESQQIVGVMPKGFAYPTADAWVPGATLLSASTDRDTAYLNVIARLKMGVSLDQARQTMAVITAREAHDFPKQHEGLTAMLVPLQDRVTSTVKPALSVMFAASAMVVLIACANLANLMLARAQVRRRELAVRSALGASRRWLIWHLTAESAVIAFIGTLLGLGLALVAISVLPKLAPDLLPDYNPLAIDGGVVAFVALVAMIALLAFGLGPAWRSAREDPAAALQDETRGGAGGRLQARSRAALVIGEVALSLVLLAGAALLIESSRRLANVDPSIDVDHLLTASITLPSLPNRPGESSDDWTARQLAATTPRVDALLERLRAMPEIESVAFTDALPLSGRGNTNSGVKVIGREYPGGEAAIPLTEWRFVSSDYFRAVGLKLLRGRAFTPEDSHGPGISNDVLVNETFVHTFLEGVEPIGQQVDVYGDKPKTIVGVVASARQWGLAREPSPEVYFPIYDCAVTTELEIVAKTRVAPATAAETLRRALRETAPDLPVTAVRTMTEVVSEGNTMRRFFSTLMIVFSAVALVLAMVGLYGLIAYSVAQRKVEIGVRMSLGANRLRVLQMVLGQGLALVGVGLLLGVVGSLALSRVLGSLLYGVGPHDPLVLGTVALVLLATGAIACTVPALRAARVAPLEALRHG
ncbi:MAG TPA: ABC transporter permease [Rhodanobacteraceae bacterium]|nr:ABC transporter permease [Rhodanobacteraceae bacterium]